MSLNPYGGPMKAHDGLIATIINQDTGEHDTVALLGATSGWGAIQHGLLDCVQDLCRICDERDGNWKISVISNPTSILRDLRTYGEETRGPTQSKAGTTKNIGNASYEELLLGRIGRRDLAVVPGWKHRRRTAA